LHRGIKGAARQLPIAATFGEQEDEVLRRREQDPLPVQRYQRGIVAVEAEDPL
jgi:hypothetical protein